MKDLNGKVAVITGAANGIGRALAVELSKLGCHIAISDVNETDLKETEKMLQMGSRNVTSHILDVSDKQKVHEYADLVKQAHGKADIVINNAGVAMGSLLETTSYEDFEWLMEINFWGVVYGSKAFLPLLKAQKDSNLVNISSINGILPSPSGGPYACSKFAVRAYTETLMVEMADSNVNFSIVHPGGIKTRIAKDSRFRLEEGVTELSHEEMADEIEKNIYKLTADQAAQIIIEGIRKNQKRIMVGSDAKFLDRFRRLFPMWSLKVCSDSYAKLMKYNF